MSTTIQGALRTGTTLRELLGSLAKLQDAGKPLNFQVEARTVPYLDHRVVGWVDGPPSSAVAFVLSGEDAAGHMWRRFTISKVGPWRYELECFPTGFNNSKDPLSPGIPPSSSRRA
jgi:hypothetical protein